MHDRNGPQRSFALAIIRLRYLQAARLGSHADPVVTLGIGGCERGPQARRTTLAGSFCSFRRPISRL